MKKLILLIVCFGFLSATEPLKEILVETPLEMKLDGQVYKYQAIAGTLVLKDKEGKDKTEVGYTAYFLQDIPSKKRPITFCFNGGPGAASIWLNTGFMGPKRISGLDIVFSDPPYELVDNESSLLDQTDMVFVDPPSTGFARAASGVCLTELHGVDEDVQAMADFIRLFTGRFNRFDSPKYFVGESYGALRAAKTAYKLHDEYGYYLNGILLVSPALDMQTLSPGGCNDLPYQLFLPSMTAIAHYHQKITGDLSSLLKDCEAFVSGPYCHALYLGDKISAEEKKEIAGRLSDFTGLSTQMIERWNLRIPNYRFIREILEKEGKVIGRFDGRISGIAQNEYETHSPYDPSLDAVIGAVTATFSQFLIKDLKWPALNDYLVLNSLSSWNWGRGNQFASGLKDMRGLMAQNPKLKVVVMGGLYDLATPYSATEFSLAHIGLNAEQLSRINQFLYPAGHMMYYNHSIRKSMKNDLSQFFK